MVGKESAKKDLEKLFSDFEKRQGQKFKSLEERVIHQFHVISEGLIDQIKLLAEGHRGIIDRLDRIEKENERQHFETRALVKLSFGQLDKRLSDLESRVREMEEWRKLIEPRLQL
jgi:hypothetical protein